MSNVESNGQNEEVRIFVGDGAGPEDFACFFEEQNARGRLYVSDRRTNQIVKHLQIYDDSKALLQPKEDDVRVFWSTDGTRCGVAIWGKMWGILDIANGREIVAPLDDRHSSAVADPKWLEGFDSYLDEYEFVRARQRYWKEKAKEHVSDVESLPDAQTPVQTNFIVYEATPNRIFAVFEDEGEAGYLYVYSPKERTLLRYLHVYDRSKRVDVSRHDIRVLWTANGLKCGVVIWDKMRGVIDLTKDVPGRVWLESRTTSGIDDPEWLSGF